MLLAELNGTCACSSASLSARLTSAWQSSNEPATRSALTLSPKQPNWCAWRGDTRPSGYSTTTRRPGWPWNAAATAAPVSPDVATRMVSGCVCPWRIRASVAARKRAPTSLNAAVGPWNSSSTWSPGVASGFSGTGKSSASAQMAGSAGASASPSKNGASSEAVVWARLAPASSARPAGNLAGTYRPPSGASPAAMAWLSDAGGEALRVEMNSMVGSVSSLSWIVGARQALQQRGAGAVQRRHPGLAVEAGPGERSLHRWRRRQRIVAGGEPGKHAGPGTGNACTHGTGIQRRRLGQVEAADQRCPPRLHQHVAQALADQHLIAGMAAGQHQRQVCTLGDEVLQRIAASQRVARATGFQHRLRMHHQAVPRGRHRDAHQPVGGGQHQTAQQHRAQVVAMAAAAGHFLAGHG